MGSICYRNHAIGNTQGLTFIGPFVDEKFQRIVCIVSVVNALLAKTIKFFCSLLNLVPTRNQY